ncbi:hypothetical protein I4U23_006766 [Adineta vaga]|nr:hypothetical protein I4U23_006766 [Adineta vaga]
MPSQQDSVTVRAVCVLKNGENNNIQGVIRFAQMIGMNQMKITGELQGLPTDRKLTFRIHEYGDLSSGMTSTGGRFNPDIKVPSTSKDQTYTMEGEYGNFQVSPEGHAKIDLIDKRLTLFGPSSIIGRSVVITDEKEEDFTRIETDENKGTVTTPTNRLAAGVIVAVSDHNPADHDGTLHQIVERTLHEITLLSPQKQAAIGGLSGIATGYCFAKASKAVAFTIGASILALAIAKQSGYIDIHFDRIRDTAQQQLHHIQRAAISTLPQSTTTNVDGEEIETFVDQSSNGIVDHLKTFAMANLAITSSFIGGFLLGVAFE